MKLRLPDGETYDQTGTIDFLNVQVDQTTDSVTVQAQFQIEAHADRGGLVGVLVEESSRSRRSWCRRRRSWPTRPAPTS